MMFSIGIDCGSRTIKLCLFDLLQKSIIDIVAIDSSPEIENQIENIVTKALKKNNLLRENAHRIVCTGYGRKKFVSASACSSEIICHATGTFFFDKSIRTVIDIGGQDAKIIKLSPKGKVLDFAMNDKCAAGSGRFLEKVADIFRVDVAQLGQLDGQSAQHLTINSTCVVFAESEIIGLLSGGHKKEDILRAVHDSIAHMIYNVSGHVGIEYPVAFVGGVAKNIGMHRALNKCLQTDLFVPQYPDFTGAIGAAICENI
jgi:predicted CoA-substrate-specific enzyme activase